MKIKFQLEIIERLRRIEFFLSSWFSATTELQLLQMTKAS